MTDQAKPVSRPWRRFLRFSVRSLIVLVIVVGGFLGWAIRSARIQRDAVAAIREAGGSVKYDWELSNGKATPKGRSRAARWLVDLIGVDHFGHVTEVSLYGTQADAAIVQVGRLTHLERLFIDQAKLNEAELTHLKGLSKLSLLCLAGSPVTDAGLADLEALTNVSDLDLSHTMITDADPDIWRD